MSEFDGLVLPTLRLLPEKVNVIPNTINMSKEEVKTFFTKNYPNVTNKYQMLYITMFSIDNPQLVLNVVGNFFEDKLEHLFVRMLVGWNPSISLLDNSLLVEYVRFIED